MTVINAADLERLRNTHPHKIIPHLSVFRPAELYCGTVTGSPAMGARQITVVDVSGGWAAVDAAAPDLMVYVGTSCGDYSKSKRRFRIRVGQVITLDENSVEWANGDVITIVLSYDLWSVFPYIDPDTKVFYKDFDITYTDQNELMDPVAIMGPHQAKFLDGPTVVFDLDGSDSYAVAQGATITGYAWGATGGAIANAVDPTTTITFDTPGTYIVTLTVTDSNVKTQSTRRVYFVHQRTGAHAPYSDFDFERSPEGSWDDGGWNCAIRVKGDADQDEFPDNALCILWAEMFWDGEEHYIVDGYNSLLVGYIIGENITKEMDTGFVNFEIGTIHKMLKNARCFSVSLEYDTSPDTWWKMDDLTVGRAVHHMWRWHSTLFYVTDVFLPILTSNTELLKAVDDFEGGDLYSIVDNFTYQHSIFAHVVCNKHGQIYVEQDFAMLDEADRAAGTTSVLLADRDRRGPVDVDFARQTPENVSHTIVSGTAYDGADAIPVIAQAPGYVPSPWGENQASFERLVLEDQLYANMIAGRVIAVANEPIQDVAVPMAGNWISALDIAPQNWVQLNIQAADTKRGVSLEDYYHLHNITSEISISGGSCLVDLNLVPEAFGPDGVPGPYPDDWPWPTFPLPDFPEFPPWAFPRWDTLMVRNCWAMLEGVDIKNVVYQRTVINDPSSILPALNGEEVMNQLYITNRGYEPEVVSDGIFIYFHQMDIVPTDYRTRIYRHDIATGAADYLELPNIRMVGGTLTVVDIGIVAALTWNATWDTITLHRVDFVAGAVSSVYSYNIANITTWSPRFCVTVQSTVNVYTVFDIEIEDGSGDIAELQCHRYNWTTGQSSVTTVWIPQEEDIWTFSMYCAPVIVDYEIFAFYSSAYNGGAPLPLKSYIVYYNFVTNESGYRLVMNPSSDDEPWLCKAAPYEDLKRIYFTNYDFDNDRANQHYISTLTKDTPPFVNERELHFLYYVCNKNKAWQVDWGGYDQPIKLVDPYTKEYRFVGLTASGEDSLWATRRRLSWCVDDMDERIYTFQGHYIIGHGVDENIIAETTIPASDNLHRVMLLGRTFVIIRIGGPPSGQDYEAWVVHYPGSLVE